MHRFTRSAAAPAAGSSASGGSGLGLPARIVCTEALAAQAVTGPGACATGLARTGPLPAGAWVQTSDGAARTVIEAGRARAIDTIARGELDGTHTRAGLIRYLSVLEREAIAR